MKVKTYFYQIGDAITICLAVTKDKQHCARGMTIRSPQDEDDEQVARDESYKYAMMGLGCSKQLRPITNPTAIRKLITSGCPFVVHGELDPVLTWREVKYLRVKSPHHFTQQYHTFRFDKDPSKALPLKQSTGSAGVFASEALVELQRRIMRGMYVPPAFLVESEPTFNWKAHYSSGGVVRKPHTLLDGGVS